MKKITALLLCFLLLCTCSVTAFAAEPEAEGTNTVISITVPDSHKITVTAENAKVFYEGVSGEEFIVERLSEPRLLIRAESGKVIKSVMLNDVDVTALLHGGYLDLAVEGSLQQGLIYFLSTRSVQFAVTAAIDICVIYLLLRLRIFDRMRLWPPKERRAENDDR